MISEALVSFLYILLRDEVPAGTVEAIMRNHVEKAGSDRRTYSNKHLAAYSREIARRLEDLS